MHAYTTFDPLLSDEEARTMVALCEKLGTFKTYGEEPTFAGLGEGLPARYDAARNFIRTGGRFARREEDLETLASRTNYFRETYAYGERVDVPGVEPFLHHEGFVEAARELFGRPIIEPAIVYANLLVPGQELAVHTDVPEFRGVNRTKHPQWLIVAMHHSGLFDDWRMPIATGVSWYHDATGGEFAFYPEGKDGEPVAHPVAYNTAVLLDTDSVFHGVDRVRETRSIPKILPGSRLTHSGNGRWTLHGADGTTADYDWSDLRYSISWKAYCFADEAEREAWRRHDDDVSVEFVVERLLDDLRDRGVIGAERPSDAELVDVLVDEYIRFPEPRSEG